MIGLNKFTIVFAVCFVFFAVLSVNGQKRYVEGLIDKPLVQKKVEREGWSVPAFADPKTEVSSDRVQIIDDVDVQTNANKLPEDIIILVEPCRSETAKSIEYKPYIVRGYTTYSADGRIFAYRVIAGVLGRYKQQFTRIPAAVTFNYVDENGSGKFRLRCNNSSEFGTLPEWVKALGSVPVVKPSRNQ